MDSKAEDEDEDEFRVNILDWQWTKWEPSDSVRHYPDGRTETISGGWDHDHCLECHAVICDKGDALRVAYYENEYGNWLCPSCYQKLVASAS